MSLRERAFGLRFGFGTLASRIRYRNSLACRCRWSSSLSTGGVYESPTGNHNDVDSLILNIPKSNVYRFGDANHVSTPVFRDLEWRIREGEAWAVVGSAGNEKSVLLQVSLFFSALDLSFDFGISIDVLPLIDSSGVYEDITFTSGWDIPILNTNQPSSGSPLWLYIPRLVHN